MTTTTTNQRTLNKLGAGWKEEPAGTFRFDCEGGSVFIRVRNFPQERTWTAVRFEIRDGVECATNGLHFPSLKKLVDELNRQRDLAD